MISKYYLCIIFIFSSLIIFGQINSSWTSFYNKDSSLIGYKDKSGIIKIEPKFTSGFTIAKKFDDIIAATENGYLENTNYYLTKSGGIVGRNNVYYFDNTPDCESEGFIRFRDKKTNKVGMFDKDGNIVIPAMYDDLSRVRNRMIIALKDAEKKYWNGDQEHYSWIGGQELLIDINNNILIDNFHLDKELNFFTLEKTMTPHPDITRKSFLAKDGSYYSFVDFEDEFKQWITKELQNDLTPERLINISYDTITWESIKGWTKTRKEKFIANNFSILKKEFLEILQPKTGYFISSDGLNPFMFEGTEFEKYFNNCGEANDWIYPTMSIIISHKNKKNHPIQNQYEFLRTDNGYKLICLTIRNEKIK